MDYCTENYTQLLQCVPFSLVNPFIFLISRSVQTHKVTYLYVLFSIINGFVQEDQTAGKSPPRTLLNFLYRLVLRRSACSDQIGRLNSSWCAQLTVRYCQSLGAEKFSRAGPRPHSGVPGGGRPPCENVEEISASRSVTPQ